MSRNATSRMGSVRIRTQRWKRDTVVLLGGALVIVTLIVGLPNFWTFGVIFLTVSIVLAMSDRSDHTIASRRHWF